MFPKRFCLRVSKFLLIISLIFLIYKLTNPALIIYEHERHLESKTSPTKSNSEQLRKMCFKLQAEKPVVEVLDRKKFLLAKVKLGGEFQRFYFPNGTFFHSNANKIKNILPFYPCYDHSRVVLSKEFSNSSDYINANFVDGYQQSKKFILTQCWFWVRLKLRIMLVKLFNL